MIKTIRIDNPFYGIRRLKIALFMQGQKVSTNRLRRVCKLFNLKPRSNSKKWIKSKDKNLLDTRIPNLTIEKSIDPITAQETIKPIKITKPNQVWASDFTYLKFQGMWYYLATTIDVHTKEITGFHISTNHNTNLIVNALNKAINTNNYEVPEIIHSDQGSEYRSIEYQNLLKTYNITPSNSNKSSPWQNGYQESFYGKFKLELELYKLPKDSNYTDIYNYIANQIDYYNNYRIHTSINNIPNRFRMLYYEVNGMIKDRINKKW